MPWKEFTPALDGRSYDAIVLPVNPGEQPYDQVLDRAYADTLAHLDRHYVGAVKCYQLDQLLSAWIEPAALRTDLSIVCKLYVLLDHFYARLPLVRSVGKGSRRLEWQGYLRDRMRDSGSNYAVARLKAIAIFGLMPESWIDEGKIKQAIFSEIRGAGAVERPAVTFDLKVAKSGVAWMIDTVVSDIKQLQLHLDYRRPQIITYVIETRDYQYRTQSVIAYHCQVLKNRKIQVNTYHPGTKRMVKIVVDTERFLFYADHERISGWYLENYEPKSVPVGGWMRVLKTLFLMQSFWYFRRLLHHFLGCWRRQ